MRKINNAIEIKKPRWKPDLSNIYTLRKSSRRAVIERNKKRNTESKSEITRTQSLLLRP